MKGENDSGSLKAIAITNQKGGKTTTTVNLGVGLAKTGHKVLLVDADPQGSLTISLGIKDPDSLNESLATIMSASNEDVELPLILFFFSTDSAKNLDTFLN